MTTPTLKPCPFCGGQATKLYSKNGTFHEIICMNTDCNMQVETLYWTPENVAIADWNRRYPAKRKEKQNGHHDL